MKRFMIVICVLAVIAVFGTFNSLAKASDFDFHISGPGYHFDVGRPHYRSVYHGGGHGWYGGGWYADHYDWHDTSHYDYHPGRYVRHRNHFHYEPGHYDLHETGHWDHHGW